MKVRELTRDFEVEVYALYWAEYQGKRQRHFLIIPYEGYEGLTGVSESECVLTDRSLGGFELVKNSNGDEMLIHHLAIEDNLLDQMIDHNPVAMEIFRKRLLEAKARRFQ